MKITKFFKSGEALIYQRSGLSAKRSISEAVYQRSGLQPWVASGHTLILNLSEEFYEYFNVSKKENNNK
jgi:hypothetical protein